MDTNYQAGDIKRVMSHPDYLGHTEFVSDANGDAYQYFWYSPFGDAIVEEHANTASFSSRYLFNAKELDPETGRYYYGARYYDPELSIWLSVDPLAGEFPNLTPYNFVKNNPILLVDPDGRAPGPGDPEKRDNRPSSSAVSDNTNINPFTGLEQHLTKSKKGLQSVPNVVSPYYSLGGDKNFGPQAAVKIKPVQNVKIGVNSNGNPTVDVGPVSVEVNETSQTNVDLGTPFQYVNSNNDIVYDVKYDPDGDGEGANTKVTYKENYQKLKILGITLEQRTLKDQAGNDVVPPQSRDGIEVGVSKGPFEFTFSLKTKWSDG